MQQVTGVPTKFSGETYGVGIHTASINSIMQKKKTHFYTYFLNNKVNMDPWSSYMLRIVFTNVHTND